MIDTTFIIIDKELRCIKTDLENKSLCIFDNLSDAVRYQGFVSKSERGKCEIVERLMTFNKCT